jgi:hypothetical protein
MISFVHFSYKFLYIFRGFVQNLVFFRTKSSFICTKNVRKNVRKISNKINNIYINIYILYMCTCTTYLPYFLCVFGCVCKKHLYICTKHNGGTDRFELRACLPPWPVTHGADIPSPGGFFMRNRFYRKE